jgi:hypothetical protein
MIILRTLKSSVNARLQTRVTDLSMGNQGPFNYDSVPVVERRWSSGGGRAEPRPAETSRDQPRPTVTSLDNFPHETSQ